MAWLLFYVVRHSKVRVVSSSTKCVCVFLLVNAWKMPLRTLLRLLANEQFVERLADSYPIRRLAQLTHYTYRRLTLWGNDALDKAVKSSEAQENVQKNPQVSRRLATFMRNFVRNIQNEIENNQQRPR